MKSFRCIVADPPWMERGGGKIKRGADRHYPLLHKHEIIETIYTSGVWYPNRNGCHLYLWVTNNHIRDGEFVMEALGFRQITMLTWAKNRIGLGQYWRGQTEHVLFGVMGKLPALVKTESTLIGKGIISRGKHSKKPEDFFEAVERVSPGPRLELFARQPRKGWVVWGNEV